MPSATLSDASLEPKSHWPNPRPELVALTSLRGLAAMAVVLQHFSSTAQSNASGWIPSIVPHGYMAVDFFFVLSGFIMPYNYLSDFRTRGMAAYGPFLWKRVARIFPLGVFVTLLILLLGGVAGLFDHGWLFLPPKENGGLPSMVVLNLLHLQGFLPSYSLNDPSWSVSVELGAYVLFPALVFLMFHRTPWVTALAVACSVATLLVISRYDPTGGLAFRWAPLDFARCLAEFCLGMLVYRVYAGGSALRGIRHDRWTWGVVALVVLALVGRQDLVAAAAFPFLVLAFAMNRGSACRALSHPWLRWLGTVSFSVYLMHHLFRAPEFWLLRLVHPAPLSPVVALVAAFLGSLTVLPFASLAYRFVERPGRDYLNWLGKRYGVRGRAST